MNPRMRERVGGTPIQPENGFQIRNPWIPQTPGNQVMSGSNGISSDRIGSQLGKRNWNEFFGLLDRRPNRGSDGLNQSSGSYSIGDQRMAGVSSTGLAGPVNQISVSHNLGNNQQMGNQVLQGGNNISLRPQMNRISGSNSMVDRRMGNGTSGQYFNSQSRIYRSDIPSWRNSPMVSNRLLIGNTVQQPSFPATNMPSSITTRTDPVTMPFLNLDSQQLSSPRGMNQTNSTLQLLNSSRGVNQMNSPSQQLSSPRGTNQTNSTLQLLNSSRAMNQMNSPSQQLSSPRGVNQMNSTLQLLNSSRGMNRMNSPSQQLSSPRGMNQTNSTLQQLNSPRGMNQMNSPLQQLSSPAGMNQMNPPLQQLCSPTGMSQTNSDHAPSILNSYSEIDSTWTEGNFTSLLLGNDIQAANTNKWINVDDMPQMCNNRFHVPVQENNDLNSPSKNCAGTSNANSFPFAPITPDYRNLLEKHRQAELLKFLVDDGSGQEHEKMENLISSIGDEAIENQCSELLQSIVGSSTVISTPQAENKISEESTVHEVIDLNETPKQKATKRRKHRPKVVIEGKPKRTPKPKTPKNVEVEENPSKKRKYVRKNKDAKVENITPQQTTPINIEEVSNSESRGESCRRKLNFDSGNAEKGENQYMAGNIEGTHYQGNQIVPDLNLNFPANQMPVESIAAGKDNCPSVVQTEIVNYNTLNAIARNLSPGSNERRDNPNTNGELNKSISRPNFSIEKSKDIRWKNTHQMVERDVGNFKGFYESKDGDFHPTKQAGPSSDPKLSSPSICQEPFQSETQGTLNPAVGNSSEETPAKLKIPNGVQKISNRPVKRRFVNSASARNTINSDNSIPDKLTTLTQQMVLERMRERMSSISNQGHGTGRLPVMTKSNQQTAASKAKKANVLGHQQQTENHKASIQNSEIRMTANDCRIVSFCRKEPNENLHQYQPPSMTARGQQKSMKYTKKVVDEITIQLQRLSINGETGETDGKDKYALVPYGGGGAMVTYEPKKRKPRPKVDLDPETTRIWKLLMGKEGSEDPEAENRNKEKWWEEERGVFHGRAESFIARMHLVQGDRRFSPWKGSVVDSIIGVFLTQNVSDQLSSSAFMALAARFPLGVATPDQTSDQSGTSILTEELENQGLTQGGTAGCFEKIIRQPFSSGNFSDISINHINGEIQSSSGSSSEVEDSSNGGKSIKNNDLTALRQADTTTPLQIVENHENRSLSFNDRSTHFNKQSAETSNNQQRPGTDRPINLNSFSPLNQPVSSSMSSMQNSAMPLSFFQLLMAPQVARTEVDCSEISREEFRSSFHSSPPEMSRAYQANGDRHTIEMMSDNLPQQNGFQNNHMPNIDRFDFLMKPLAVQDSSAQQGPQIVKNVHHQEKISQVYEPEHRGYKNPSRPNETVNTLKSGRDHVPSASKHAVPTFDIQEGTSAANKQVLLGERSSHGHGNGQASSSGETITGRSAKTLDTSLKRDKEKREAFDWDSLRKTAQASAGGKERSIDASDSMDYEAMRCADVNVISDSIRIRGMNNMLSERIKDFLNRVVRDHGSIDLEWLRDVPPDKAKDYLLSIRGLGLKSVECVRLLTLHHLAFPVDTNVGRIAVRLGWVPLQPLPESLQLHLLEMYPVLESVQKYLWPRLCKLDQKTLYELHYQLITFGKVFCTKSKPNCNACPMRGECRHFASAFASARLALPAPEEKGIVSSTMPIATDRRAHMINPMLLQPSCSNGERELTVNRCEPIIEEPASPEPEIIEIAETDIEDAFYEDPDDIPTIRLNVEQLAVNLRNFMEEHTNLQEGDMSRALVALTPEVASIPVPKLKYVLRLRTERQVYVLPDTHPLVRGLDKREPDDPSPYLLALLAPGEEAGSGQPSKTCSGSNGSEKLCKEKECSPVIEEENSLTVRGTLLIPCRTAMRGSFPLNGTYFQVNEVFADHESSLNPIDVPRAWLWHLETRTVLFGTSATSIFRGMTTKEIQSSFWRGFVCVRGFDRKTRAPRPLNRNLHIPHSKTLKTSNAA